MAYKWSRGTLCESANYHNLFCFCVGNWANRSGADPWHDDKVPDAIQHSLEGQADGVGSLRHVEEAGLLT